MTNKLPVYNVRQILAAKTRLENDPELNAFLYATLSGEIFDDFVDEVRVALSMAVARDVVEDSCRYLLGEELDLPTLETLAWRLAANTKRLSRGHPVPPWEGQDSAEWVVAQIMGWEVESRRGKIGARFRFKVLAGQAVGESCEDFWSRRYCYVLSLRMGFTKLRGGYPFADVREFSGLRLFLRIVPNDPVLSFDQVTFPQSCISWNKRQIKRRARRDFKCPKGFGPQHHCYQCYVGRDQCPAAVHPLTYAKRHCKQCNQQSWFDEDEVCVDCHVVNTLRGRN